MTGLVNVYLIIFPGSRPQESKGTLVRFSVKNDAAPNTEAWYAQITRKEGLEMDLAITPPADGIIGNYNVFVETRCSDDTHSYQYRREFSNKFIMLFNPWCNGEPQNHWGLFNTLRPKQNGPHLPDDIFNCIFLNENI